MMARKPEECDLYLMEAMNRGDLEAAVALYEPTATLVQDPSGEIATGHPAIREVIGAYLALHLASPSTTHGEPGSNSSPPR